jgi:hypothetical protein
MVDNGSITDAEIAAYITLIEKEIDLCLEYDLPILHLVAEINTLNDVVSQRTADAHSEDCPSGNAINATAPELAPIPVR